MMATPAPDDDFGVQRAYTLSRDMSSYIVTLARRAPGIISFRTGSGRIFRDLMIHWPTLEDWENEALELCERISDAVYPLAGSLFAQAVEISITISWKPLAAPTVVSALSNYILFDAEEGIERHFFLSPKQALPPQDLLTAPRGIAIVCRPLHYRYHTIKDDRKRIGHPHAGIFELSERLINALNALPPFAAPETALLAKLKTQVFDLSKKIQSTEIARAANLAQPIRHLSQATPVIASVTSLSALPPPVRALERQLMVHVLDRALSPELRLGLRQVAQTLRAHYPQAVLEEAALRETARPVVRPAVARAAPTATPTVPQTIPRATPQPAAHAAPLATPRPAVQATPYIAPIRATPTNIPLSVRPTVIAPVIAATQTPRGAAPQPAARPATRQPARQPTAQAEPHPERPAPQRAAQQHAPQPAARAEPVQQVRSARPTPTQTARAPTAAPRAEVKPPAHNTPEPQLPFEPRTPTHAPKAEPAPRDIKNQPRVPHTAEDLEFRPTDFYQKLKPTIPTAFPKAIPDAAVGKLNKTVSFKPTLSRQAALHKARLWATLPTPTPTLMPFMPFLKGK